MYLDPQASKRKPNVTIANEAVGVADAKDDPRMLENALDYVTWLPFAAKTYDISPNISDYVLVNTPICPSDIPNRNGIAFPRAELVKFQPPPISRMAYKAWAGCPVHYEHANEIHTDAYGVILDTSFSPIVGYGGGQLWKVMGILAIDKKKYPKMAQRVMEGSINTYSMGAWVDSFSCSYCSAPMTERNYCSHVNPKNQIDWREFKDYDGTRHIAVRNAHGISPIETSLVESPAWTTALSDEVLGCI